MKYLRPQVLTPDSSYLWTKRRR